MDFSITSVEKIPNLYCLAAFPPKTTEVFKETEDTAPIPINDKMQHMPWGADNNMPYDILELIESNETLSTCQQFNAEMCYGAGLVYDTTLATAQVKQEVEDFLLTTYFFGVPQRFQNEDFYYSTTWEHQQQEICFLATFFQKLELSNICGITVHRWNKYQKSVPNYLSLSRTWQTNTFARYK